MSLNTFFTLFLLIISLSLAKSDSVIDFCVADRSLPKTPAGYPCRNPANLTADDFVFSGLNIAGNMSNVFKSAATAAMDDTFPAMNGLGLSMFRLDIGVDGVIPIHSHRVSEVIILIEGTIIAGFIGSDNTAYYKTLNKGDLMIFPQSLLHFQVNVGKTPALAYVSLNSPNPGFQLTSLSLGANDLPTEVIKKITLLDVKDVKKLKRIFGGTH